jgi:hypothetical protein
MDGTGKRSWLIGKHGGGAITLMDIAIENQQSLYRPTGQELLRRKGQVIEDAETGTEIVMGMMGTPRQMTGQSLFQGQLGGKQGAHGRDTGAFYQPLTPRQPQATLGFRVQGTGNDIRHISGTMGLAKQGRLGSSRAKFIVATGNSRRPQMPVQQTEFFHGETVFAGKGKAVVGVINEGQHRQSQVKQEDRNGGGPD